MPRSFSIVSFSPKVSIHNCEYHIFVHISFHSSLCFALPCLSRFIHRHSLLPFTPSAVSFHLLLVFCPFYDCTAHLAHTPLHLRCAFGSSSVCLFSIVLFISDVHGRSPGNEYVHLWRHFVYYIFSAIRHSYSRPPGPFWPLLVPVSRRGSRCKTILHK